MKFSWKITFLQFLFHKIEGIKYDDYINTLLERFQNELVQDTLLRLTEDSVNRLETSFVTESLFMLLKKLMTDW